MESHMVIATGASGVQTVFDGRISISLSCLGSFHVAQTMINNTGAVLCQCQWLPVMQFGRQRLQVQCASQDRTTESHLSAQERFESFLREREPKVDLVSKASDLLWRRAIFDVNDESLNDAQHTFPEYKKVRKDDNVTGFLKLSQARRWSSGVDGAPENAKLAVEEIEMSREGRRLASFLEYEAASLSYGIGAIASLLYLKLLFHHAGKISEDNVAEVFLQPQRKSLALSSPRLVIPAALFGLWKILHESSDTFFSLQLAPLIFGFFAYKGALLIQTFRDNKELAVTLPKDEVES